MHYETHRHIDKSVKVASVLNDTRFLKASLEVNDDLAEMSVMKTEPGAKADVVDAKVDSCWRELARKIYCVDAHVDFWLAEN